MHMTDALLSPAVAGVMTAVGGLSLTHAAKKSRFNAEADDRSIPLMGVTGAFVFAAQMINIAIPGTGASGHLGGGVLLAALLGPYKALITLSAVLLMQCLFFADGGLLAYGCNVFNMGVCACWLAYGLLYKPILRRGVSPKRIVIASVAASVLALQLGSLGVVLETSASGVAGWSVAFFAALMQPIHLAIGLMEGAVTATALCLIHQTRPSLLYDTSASARAVSQPVPRRVIAGVLAAALFIGGALSFFASTQPDGLEWSIEKAAETGAELKAPDSQSHLAAERLVERTAFMPDYTVKGESENATATRAAVIGISVAAAALAAGAGAFLRRRHG